MKRTIAGVIAIILMLGLSGIVASTVNAYTDCQYPYGNCLVPKWASCHQDGDTDKDQLVADLYSWVEGYCYPAVDVVYCVETFEIFPGVFIGKIWFSCQLV